MPADEIIINIVQMATTKWRPHSRLIEFAPLRWTSLRGPISYLCFVSSLFICVYIFSLSLSFCVCVCVCVIIASTCFVFLLCLSRPHRFWFLVKMATVFIPEDQRVSNCFVLFHHLFLFVWFCFWTEIMFADWSTVNTYCSKSNYYRKHKSVYKLLIACHH